jgi:glycerol-3-phosphate acyltransferase PlsY
MVASYLLGAIPTSYLTVKLTKGQDLRRLGSGNLGATNLYRVLGWRYALPVGLFDMMKGAVPVLVFARAAEATELTALLFGIAAVIGHVFSVFVGFKGGKGVATGAGVILGLAPLSFLAALAGWLLVLKASGYVSLASMTAAAVLVPATYLLHPERRDVLWVFAGLALAIVALHWRNIGRLRAGTEHRFGSRAS